MQSCALGFIGGIPFFIWLQISLEVSQRIIIHVCVYTVSWYWRFHGDFFQFPNGILNYITFYSALLTEVLLDSLLISEVWGGHIVVLVIFFSPVYTDIYCCLSLINSSKWYRYKKVVTVKVVSNWSF